MKIRLAGLLLAGAVLAAPRVGDPAPSLGSDPMVTELAGQVVLVDFWASWCGPCQQSFPWLDSLHQALQDKGFSVLAVNEDRKWSKAERFLKDHPVSFPVLPDAQGELAARYQLEGMPSTYLLDRQGVVRLAHTGFREEDKALLLKEILPLLETQEVQP